MYSRNCVIISTLFVLILAEFVHLASLPLSANSKPISVYQKLEELTTTKKCTYLQTTELLQNEPSFLKPCDNADEVLHSTFSAFNIKPIHCTLFYDTYEQLCNSYNEDPKKNIVPQLINPASIKQAKIHDVSVVCKQLEDFYGTYHSTGKLATSMQDDSICGLICTDSAGKVAQACTLAALMANVNTQQLQFSVVLNANKSVVEQVKGPGSASGTNVVPSSVSGNIGKSADNTDNISDNAKMMVPADKLADYQLKVVNEPNSVVSNANSVASPASGAGSAQNPVSVNDIRVINHSLGQQLPTIEKNQSNLPITSVASSKIVTSQEANLHVAPGAPHSEEHPADGSIGRKDPIAVVQPAQADSKSPRVDGDLLVQQPVQQPAGPSAAEHPGEVPTESKGKIDNGKKTTTTTTTISSNAALQPNDIDYNGGVEMENNEEMEEAKFETPKQAGVRNLYPVEKPTQTNEDNDANPMSNDSYFFSYFMLFCILFVFLYVGYHNKQKLLALVLEGRRGRRQQRRRPNSANYHKLDSNLEEAVTSSCDKTSSNVIY